MKFNHRREPSKCIGISNYLSQEIDRNLLDGGGLEIAPLLEGNSGTDISISMWIKPKGGFSELVYWLNPANFLSSNLEVFSSGTRLGTTSFAYANSQTLPANLFPDNRWYHVVVAARTGASSTGRFSVYLDGVRMGTEVIHSNATPLLMSSLNKMIFLRGFSGKVARLSIFGQYFSATDAAAVFGRGISQSLVGLYKAIYDFKMTSDNVTTNSTTQSISNFETSPHGWTIVAPGWEGVPPGSDPTARFQNTATITLGSTTVQNISNALIKTGMRVTGIGIPENTFVSVVNSGASTITLTNAATSTSTLIGATLSFFDNIWAVGTADKFSGTKGLYVTNGGGTASYSNINGTATYAYRNITVPAGATILSLRAKLPYDGAGLFDWLRVIIGNTSFVPAHGTAYTATVSGNSVTYSNANILKMGPRRVPNSSTVGVEGIGMDRFRELTMDLSQFAGQTVRLVFGFECDFSGSSSWSCVIDDVQFKGKHSITGTRYESSDFADENRVDPNTVGAPTTLTTFNQASASQWYTTNADVLGVTKKVAFVAASNSYTASYSSTASWSHFCVDTETDDIAPMLHFKALVGGETAFDYLTVRVVDNANNAAVRPVAGSQYTATAIASIASINLTTSWRDYYFNLATWLEQNGYTGGSTARLLIVFSWRNDAGAPPAGINGLGARISDVKFLISTGVRAKTVTADLTCQSLEFSDDQP